jgi:nicotinamidase-related amidase
MKMDNRNEFLIRSTGTLGELFDMLGKLPEVKLEDLNPEKTTLVIVDMVNGFAREGALQSPRVEELVGGISMLSERADQLGIPKLAFADNHSEASPEFGAYPVHCIAGTSEGEIVDEIKEIGGYRLIPKNSTNGFLEPEFQEWLGQNPEKDIFIVTGDCTDICIQQFATTLNTWFNMQNRKARIIVPANLVETYDFGLHNGDLVHVMALYNMMINGIEIVKGVD